MCNHCNHNGDDQKAQEYAQKVFLSQLAETSTEISRMTSGILAKDIDGQVEIYSFGSLKDILSISSNAYLGSLEFALEKAIEGIMFYLLWDCMVTYYMYQNILRSLYIRQERLKQKF